MAIGARRGSSAEVTIAATGIAGPGGGLPHKPVGLVCFAWSVRGGRIETASQVFRGDRDSVRRQTVLRALEGVLEVLPD
jgi:nicotinamide-nucleotide amidase